MKVVFFGPRNSPPNNCFHLLQAQLKVVGRSEKELKEVAVVVTCYGATSSDAELLKGGESAPLSF